MQLTRFFQFGRGLPALARAGLFSVIAALSATGAAAQNPFSPAIFVNEAIITHFELDQRAKFLEILRAPGDPEELAREALIDDRLRAQALAETEITVTSEQIQAGIEEFAGRTNLSAQEFLRALGEEGIAPETLRDFVSIGVAWREYMRLRFLENARPTGAEIDRAMAADTSGRGLRVLLAEVIIPTTPENLEQVEALTEEISEIRSYAEFEEAARRYSAAETRERGGQLGWLALSNLPRALQPTIAALNPGESTQPIILPTAIAVFQMRGIQEIVGPPPRYAAIDYATYFIPGGRSPEALAAAAALETQVDRCDDLYGIAFGQPPEVLERQNLPPSQIPRGVALELAKLDEGEISTALTTQNGENLMFLMLCGRTAILNKDVDRAQVATALTQNRLNQLSDSFIAQLRADALIIER